MKNVGLIAGSILAVLGGLSWLGLNIQPQPYPALVQQTSYMEMVPLPADLPAPIERFYRVTYGERIPLIKSAVISGRGTIRPFGNTTFPMRFRFKHNAGHDFRAYIELTAFGLPLMQVNDYYVHGKGRMVTPVGSDEGAQIDQGSNLRLWAEALNWFPAILLTDPRVRWEPVDEATALLVVPYGATQQRFVVRFDQESGKLQHFEAMRYKAASGRLTLWIDGIWMDEGRPWAAFNVDEIVYNVDVDTTLEAKGP